MPNPDPSPDTRFQPGESGNPAGKKPGTRNFTTLVREALQKVATGMKDGNPNNFTYEQILADQIIKRGITGNDRVAKMIWEHLDGRPTQKVNLDLGVDKEGLADLTDFFRSVAKPKKE